MRRNELLLKDYADRHQVPLTFTNAQALIAHPEIDAIYIDTPPQHIQQHFIENVVSYFLGNSNNPCTAQDALQSMMAMETFVNGTPQ